MMSLEQKPTSEDSKAATKLDAQKAAMAAFMVFIVLAITAADVFAFLNGATATISQVWLGLNRKFWILTYVLAILCGILIQHVSVPRDPGVTPDAPFWPQSIAWSIFFILGMWITSKWLWQLPNID